MESIINGEMQAYLSEVEDEFQSGLRPWWDEISAYLPQADEDLGYQLLPAMVVNAYRYLELDRNLAITMANLFKTFNFANIIHCLVKDDREGQKHNRELQFNILIGDFLFGRVLKLLLETEADKLLGIFAAMIATVNEGLVIKNNLHGELEQVLTKARAPLYEGAFLSAAKMANWDPGAAEVYGKVGHNLGMALELISIYDQQRSGHTYLDNVDYLLKLIQTEEIHGRGELEKLVLYLRSYRGGSINGL